MHLGILRTEDDGRADAALGELAQRLLADGLRVIGAVQSRDGGTCADDMLVRLLPEGRLLCISQDLGAGAEGCRLDADALEGAVARIEGAFAAGDTDLLIVNRFGKLEAEGRGFAPLIARALGDGVPVICGLAPKLAPAFEAFAQGLGETVPADPAALALWWQGTRLRAA